MPDDDQPNWGRFMGLGLEIAVGVGLGLAVGLWLDRRYNSSPWGMLIGSMVGLAAGMYLLIKDVMRINKD